MDVGDTVGLRSDLFDLVYSLPRPLDVREVAALVEPVPSHLKIPVGGRLELEEQLEALGTREAAGGAFLGGDHSRGPFGVRVRGKGSSGSRSSPVSRSTTPSRGLAFDLRR